MPPLSNTTDGLSVAFSTTINTVIRRVVLGGQTGLPHPIRWMTIKMGETI